MTQEVLVGQLTQIWILNMLTGNGYQPCRMMNLKTVVMERIKVRNQLGQCYLMLLHFNIYMVNQHLIPAIRLMT